MCCPTFHLRKAVERDDIPPVHAARDGLIARAKAFLQDQGGSAMKVHVYCSPDVAYLWKEFLEKLGATEANLVTIDVS
jgi:hypothetical protein